MTLPYNKLIKGEIYCYCVSLFTIHPTYNTHCIHTMCPVDPRSLNVVHHILSGLSSTIHHDNKTFLRIILIVFCIIRQYNGTSLQFKRAFDNSILLSLDIKCHNPQSTPYGSQQIPYNTYIGIVICEGKLRSERLK